jgi:hypothetical protein
MLESSLSASDWTVVFTRVCRSIHLLAGKVLSSMTEQGIIREGRETDMPKDLWGFNHIHIYVYISSPALGAGNTPFQRPVELFFHHMNSFDECHLPKQT